MRTALAKLLQAPARVAAPRRDPLAPVIDHVLADDAARQRHDRSQAQAAASGLSDYVFASSPADAHPDRVFDRLRWGGQAVLAAPRAAETEALLAPYRNKTEWFIEQEPRALDTPRFPRLGSWAHGIQTRLHHAVVRKVLLDPVSRLTARHSYDVRLVRARGRVDQKYATDGWVVLKRVPTLEQAVARLTQTAPDADPERLGKVAAKLVHKIFPVFLTREAAFLKLLQRDLPPDLKARTPRVLSMESDDTGLVRAMSMRWLRQGGEPLSQLDFARQAARLLRALHRHVGVMHLDLRLENMLVTDHGVSLVDFGSSVRIGENTRANPMIGTLIDEMLGASQITADLRRQRKKGLVRAEPFGSLPDPPTPAFDLFALASNMTRPHDHPEFKGLVHHDRGGPDARELSRLRRRVLQPRGDEPAINSVDELCRALGLDLDEPAGAPAAPPSPRLTPVILEGPSLPPRGGRPTPKVEQEN